MKKEEYRKKMKNVKLSVFVIIMMFLLMACSDSEFAPADDPPYTITIPPTFDSAFVWANANTLIQLSMDGEDEIFVNTNGDEIMLFHMYREVMSMGGDLFVVRQRREWGVVDIDNNEVISFGKYDGIWNAADGLLFVEHQGEKGVVDLEGKEVIPFGMEDHFLFNEDLLVVAGENRLFIVIDESDRDNGRHYFGVINIEGEEIIPFGFGAIIGICGGLFQVVRDGKAGIIDVDGNEIIPFDRHKTIMGGYKGWFVVGDRVDGISGISYGVVDVDGNVIIPFGRYSNIRIAEGGAAVQCPESGLWGVIRFNLYPHNIEDDIESMEAETEVDMEVEVEGTVDIFERTPPYVEWVGFDSPEDAVIEFLEGLRDLDTARMDRAVSDDFYNGNYADEKVDRFIAVLNFLIEESLIFGEPYEFQSLEIIEFIPPEALSELYLSEGNQTNLTNQAERAGVDQLVSRVVIFELGGKRQIMMVNVAELNGEWLIEQFGGNLYILLRHSPLMQGIIPSVFMDNYLHISFVESNLETLMNLVD